MLANSDRAFYISNENSYSLTMSDLNVYIHRYVAIRTNFFAYYPKFKIVSFSENKKVMVIRWGIKSAGAFQASFPLEIENIKIVTKVVDNQLLMLYHLTDEITNTKNYHQFFLPELRKYA